MREVTLDICPRPALYPYYHQEGNEMVVMDILRANTSAVAVLDHGAKEITPVVMTEEVESLFGKSHVVAAERNIMHCPWVDLGNDPSELTVERVGGHSIVSTTTNGTQAIHATREAGAAEIIVGASSDLTAVTCHCQASERTVTVLISGRRSSFCIEDTLCGVAFLDEPEELGTTCRLISSSCTALELCRQHRTHLYDYLYNCDHDQYLTQRGYPESLRLCFEQDCSIHIPTLNEAEQLYV